MQDVDIAIIKKRSIRGIFALTYRTLAVQVLGFAANFILTIFLSPSVFGVYFVVSAAIAFLSYFSDIGLAAALIQKKDEISDDDLKTTFTIQQILVVLVVLISLLASGFIKSFYSLDSSGIFLFQALVIAFFLSSLKTIPSIILERKLEFGKLVIPQIVESLVFNIIVVVLAIKGFGMTSFAIAVLARGAVGLIAIYLISPWKVRLGISKESAKKLLSFGIPFQANSFIAFLKDDLLIAYLGKVLPIAQVGYIGFAQKWAFMPLRLIMDNVIRITFPSFSRLQGNKNLLGQAVEKSIFGSALIVLPSLAGLVIMAPYFIKIIPKYDKWEPAIFSLAFFALNGCLSSISTPLTNALNAIGKIKITLYLMVFWTISTWALTPILIMLMGYNGVAVASFIISLSVVIVVYISKKYIEFNVSSVFYPFLASLVMSIFIYFLMRVLPINIVTIFSGIALGAILYFVLIFLMAKRMVISDFQMVKENVFNK
ncbi:MAG: oligosaccharide flippase family protein [Patescibacteria group bacterium]